VSSPDVVIIGNLTIDDVVRYDGETTMASPGGNAIYAGIAARIWGLSVGVVARLGSDFPRPVLEHVRAAGLDTAGLRPFEGPTVRNWVIYEEDGRRSWVYRTPPERRSELAVEPADIPKGWVCQTKQHPPVIHVASMLLGAAARVVAALRQASPSAVITLDSHEDWQATWDEVKGLARLVDVFVPSRGELAAIVGYDDPSRACAQLLADGVRAVIVKSGAEGAFVATREGGLKRVGPPEVEVVDTTGAGDSFCGGLAAGLALGEDLVVAARRAAATAGAALGASGSLRLLRRAAIAERLWACYERGEPPIIAPFTGMAQNDDSDVMEREIATIPAVVRGRLDLASQAAQVVERLRDLATRDLVLVGCGDSAFACQAAELALNKHSGLWAHFEHALDFARYRVRYYPKPSAVVVLSFSGKTGRSIEAARQARAFGHFVVALTGHVNSPLAQEADTVLSAEVPTFGFSPGTSTYIAMLMTLLTLAAELSHTPDQLCSQLGRLPFLAQRTLDMSDAPSRDAAESFLSARVVTFLGAGPNEASGRFGAAKLFEGAQKLAFATNVEEWAHEQYFVTRPGDPIVIVAPSGAGRDRAGEILSEVNYIGASPIWVSDEPPPEPALYVPFASGVNEELSPVLASVPLSKLGLYLMRFSHKRSYNFVDEAAAREHYDTIHRVTVNEPA